MEKRAILAIALSAAILILYQFFFMPSPPPPPEAPKSETRRELLPGKSSGPSSLPFVPAPPVVPRTAVVPSREIGVDTPRFRVSITTAGGKISNWVMKYRGERSVVPNGSSAPFGFSIQRANGQPSDLPMETRGGNLVLSSTQREGTIRLEGVDQYRLAVVAEFRFNAEDDRAQMVFSLENRNQVPQEVQLSAGWSLPSPPPPKGETADSAVRFTQAVSLSSAGLVGRQDVAKLSERKVLDGQRWVAVDSTDHYIAALIPEIGATRAFEEGGQGKQGEIGLIFPSVTLAPGERAQVGMALYVGPKEYDRLRRTGVGLEESIDFGKLFWIPFLEMKWVCIPLLWLMNIIYRYIGNYGVAIILLTLLTRVLFYPLTQKSMSSMKQMQALQPQLNALRAKYKNDNQRLQRETMELYRKQGVNPMGGCLPIVIQIPIFYALYVTLTVAVELQQSPLLCLGHLFGREVWICDLSKQDPTFLLPLLMGASMFIQQKMTPTVGDPRQAKIMLLLPIIFTYTFLTLPSGLVLYWLVSNILSIAQQTYMNRRARRPETTEKEGAERLKEKGKK